MSLVDSLRSATYNPEAEKTMSAEREKAAKVMEDITRSINDLENSFTLFSSKPQTPAWTLKELEKTIKNERLWLQRNTTATEQVAKAKLSDITKRNQQIFEINIYIYLLQSLEKIMNYVLATLGKEKKMLSRKDQEIYKGYMEELSAVIQKNKTTPTLVDIKIFFNRFFRELETFSKPKGIWDITSQLLDTSFRNPEKFEEDIGTLLKAAEEVKKVDDEKFSFQRFLKKITATAGSIVGILFYVVFCMVIGMLAANQAIGREPAYRVLYFIYGSLFAPLLVFYYIYLWFNDKAPKIYTLLPITQTVADTTIGKFLLFPFSYQEDKSARDLLVDFLSQSAEMVGKTFDPKTLGSLGNQVETVADNLKNLTADLGKGTPITKDLPSLTSLTVNA